MQFTFGKYDGMEINHVIQLDLPYCKWVLEKTNIPNKEKFKDFVEELKKQVAEAPEYDDSDLVIRFGEYNGYTVDEIIHDKDYCEWLLQKKSFIEEYPNIHKELEKLYDLHYSILNPDKNTACFYILFFKDRDYIKIGFTKDFIVRRIYNYSYTMKSYKDENIDLEKSIVYKTNCLDIENLIKEDFEKYRVDSIREKFYVECFQDIKDYIKQLSTLDNDYFFLMKPLKEFIPFKDGFDFKDKFKLKINEFQDFKEKYEEQLKKLKINNKYIPEFTGIFN